MKIDATALAAARVAGPTGPSPAPLAADSFALVARAIGRIVSAGGPAPALGELAAGLGVSPFQLQRAFTAWAGVSPKRFAQFLSKERALAALREGRDVLDASLAAGISSPGRMHDLLVTCEAVSPGEVARLGARLTIRWAIGPGRFGPMLLGETPRGVCHLRFVADESSALQELRREWPLAQLIPDASLAGLPGALLAGAAPARLWLRGTNFQIKVWEALLRVPAGLLLSYGDLARRAGAPRAARAVGGAVGANPVALLIPCHRVIRESGALGDYRWGAARKAAILGCEAATQEKARRAAGLSGSGAGATAACPAAGA